VVSSPRTTIGAPPSFLSQSRPHNQNKHSSSNYTNATLATPSQPAHKRKQPSPSASHPERRIGIHQHQNALNIHSANKSKRKQQQQQQQLLPLTSPIKRLRLGQDFQSNPSTLSPENIQGECKIDTQVPTSQAQAGHRPSLQTINKQSGFPPGKSLQLSLKPLRGCRTTSPRESLVSLPQARARVPAYRAQHTNRQSLFPWTPFSGTNPFPLGHPFQGQSPRLLTTTLIHIPFHYLTGDWSGFYNTIREVAASPCPTPGKSPFMFELSETAATHNSNIIASFDYDLESAIQSHGFTHLSMGSELRPLEQLEPLLKYHPYFHELKQIASKGVDYPLSKISEEVRIQQLELQLKQGNQETALTDEAIPIVTKLLLDDIKCGFSIVVTAECLRRLKHAEVYPYGLIHQTSIDEHGNPIPKKRLKHNLSVRKKSGLAINQRTIDDQLTDTQYGFALSRHLHKIHAIRFNNPGQRILCNKVDIDKAFRRLHTTPEISAKCCSTWHTHTIDSEGNLMKKSDTEVGTILTRLPFGASAAPAKFSIFSEISFDLADELIHCEQWDTDELLPPLHEQIPQPSRLEDGIPFGPALPVDVQISPDTKGGAEGYVDDGTNAVLDSPENSKMVERTRLCNLMALHLICRPHAGDDEPIHRSHIASIRKLLAEGGLAETYTFLGWLINTRLLTIALPREKWSVWLKSVVQLLQKDKASFDELSTLVGRLEHVCYIIPSARHFMNRLRLASMIADTYRVASLSNEVKLDLKLWIKFLSKAHEGISINNVVFRSPTSIPLSDASETGIGGYSLQHNILWRYEFTIEEQRSFTLNTKEYIAAVIAALISLQNDPCDYPCVLSLSDSSNTVSWLHKSNHDPASLPVHNEIARCHASNLLEHQASDFSQHIPGSDNHVADSLSRDFHLSNEQLLSLLNHTCPHLLPSNPQVSSLPTHLSLWIGSLAQLQPKKRNWSGVANQVQ